MPTPAAIRQDFRDAAQAFITLVNQVPDDAWGRPGLGVWTVRHLVGHTGRSFRTIEDYLALPPGSTGIPDALAYFQAGRASGLSNSDAVAARGRADGEALGPEPASAVRELAERVLHLVDITADHAPATARFGTMQLIEYLPTRTFELVVHGLDLRAALDLPLTVPRGPLASALRIATDLALAQDLGPELLLALTGRRPLPEGTCVL